MSGGLSPGGYLRTPFTVTQKQETTTSTPCGSITVCDTGHVISPLTSQILLTNDKIIVTGADTGGYRGRLVTPFHERKNYMTTNIKSQATLLANERVTV